MADVKHVSRRVVEITADGSATIYLPELEEHYHSVKGAYAEAKHVYVDCGLLSCGNEKVRVLEVGFGTGLNAALSAACAVKPVEYFGFELYPLPDGMIEETGYYSALPEGDLLRKIHWTDWECMVPVTDRFSIKKIKADITDPALDLPDGINVVYFDAFAPEKQPEMWERGVFERLFAAMAPGGVLVTYCAKGEVRRRLQSVGFTVERLPGPAGGKREILRATHP